jgi:hypothetical protein
MHPARRSAWRLLGAAGFEVEEDLGPAQLNARFFAGSAMVCRLRAAVLAI